MALQSAFKTIASRDNATYKRLKSLRDPRKAHQAGVIFVEGFRQVEDALLSGIVPQVLLVRPGTFDHERWPQIEGLLTAQLSQVTPHASDKSIEFIVLDERLFADVSATATPQGIALLAQSPVLTERAGSNLPLPDPAGRYLALENVQDPGNLGTMIRTADAFAFTAVLLIGSTADPYSDKALRAAMGSTFHLPLYRFSAITPAATWLKQAAVPLLAAALDGDPIDPLSKSSAGALLIGNEGSGLSPEAQALADQRIKIAMPGRAESLNAAAAAAILCHWLANSQSMP